MPNLNEAGFVTKVNSTATQILYSTFLGGSSRERVDGIAVDGQGKIHVTGNTGSTDFPTTANAWDRTCGADGACNPYYDGAWHNAEDVFYSKIDPLKAGAAGLMYSTFLGGANRDFGEAIAIDKNGRAWITGRTASPATFQEFVQRREHSAATTTPSSLKSTPRCQARRLSASRASWEAHFMTRRLDSRSIRWVTFMLSVTRDPPISRSPAPCSRRLWVEMRASSSRLSPRRWFH